MRPGPLLNGYCCPWQFELAADSGDSCVQARFKAWLHRTGGFAGMARPGANSGAWLLERQTDPTIYSTQAPMQIE